MKYTFFNDDALERVTSGYLSVEDRAVFYGDGTQEIQVKVSYPNQYGISCIKSPCSYGEQYDLWEVAILFGDDQCCDTYITNDVCGYATDEDVARIAEMVRDLVDEDEDFLAEIELLYGNSPPLWSSSGSAWSTYDWDYDYDDEEDDEE